MEEEELLCNLAIQKIPGIGSVLSRRLIETFGSAKNVFSAGKKELIKVAGLGDLILKNFKTKEAFIAAEREIKWIKKNNVIVSGFGDVNYPKLLNECMDAPTVLFYNIPVDWNNDKIISIVGTRQATTMGIEFCKKLVSEIKGYKPIVISGLAYGIDVVAHCAAMENDLQTIAVLGSGLNKIYPSEHSKYIKSINEKGGLVTEFWMTDIIDRENFIKRNRIIAGISEATIVIESDLRGGSMNTVRFANNYKRNVFAVPGRLTDVMSRGCNHLIKTNRAQLLTSSKDLISGLNWKQKKPQKKVIQPELFLELSKEEQLVYDYLKIKSKELFDLIALGCEIPIYKASIILLQLELKGLVRPLPGKLFECI